MIARRGAPFVGRLRLPIDGYSGGRPAVPARSRRPKDTNPWHRAIHRQRGKGNDVVLFMKGTPQFPMCGFSGAGRADPRPSRRRLKGLNVLESEELRHGIKAYSNWPTIPQLYVKGEFVGGCDIIREMFQAGELQRLLKEKGVPVKSGVRLKPRSSTRRAPGRFDARRRERGPMNRHLAD